MFLLSDKIRIVHLKLFKLTFFRRSIGNLSWVWNFNRNICLLTLYLVLNILVLHMRILLAHVIISIVQFYLKLLVAVRICTFSNVVLALFINIHFYILGLNIDLKFGNIGKLLLGLLLSCFMGLLFNHIEVFIFIDNVCVDILVCNNLILLDVVFLLAI